MAKRRKAKRASKSQGITLNWAIVGLIVVIALLIGLWQINSKPQSQAASSSTVAQVNWKTMVKGLSAGVNKFDGKISLRWDEVAVPGFEIVGYRVRVLARGADNADVFDLSMSQLSSNQAKGSPYVTRFASVTDMAIIKAIDGVVRVEPMIQNAVYSPSGQNQPAAGAQTTVILNV